jgi:hypothetical protein
MAHFGRDQTKRGPDIEARFCRQLPAYFQAQRKFACAAGDALN